MYFDKKTRKKMNKKLPFETWGEGVEKGYLQKDFEILDNLDIKPKLTEKGKILVEKIKYAN